MSFYYDSSSSDDCCCCVKQTTPPTSCVLVRVLDDFLEDAEDHTDVVVMDAVPITPGPNDDVETIASGLFSLTSNSNETLSFDMNVERPDNIPLEDFIVTTNMVVISPNGDENDIVDSEILTTVSESQIASTDPNQPPQEIFLVKQQVEYTPAEGARLAGLLANGNQLALRATLKVKRRRSDGSELEDAACATVKQRLFRYEDESKARIGLNKHLDDTMQWQSTEKIGFLPNTWTTAMYVDYNLHTCPVFFDITNVTFQEPQPIFTPAHLDVLPTPTAGPYTITTNDETHMVNLSLYNIPPEFTIHSSQLLSKLEDYTENQVPTDQGYVTYNDKPTFAGVLYFVTVPPVIAEYFCGLLLRCDYPDGSEYIVRGYYKCIVTQAAIDSFLELNKARVGVNNSIQGDDTVKTISQGIIDVTQGDSITFTNISPLLNATCADMSCTAIHPVKYWNKTAWTIVDLQGQAATIPLSSETYVYAPFFGNQLSYDMTIKMDNYYENNYINSAYSKITIRRTTPERTTVFRTMNSNWLTTNDHFPNTNNSTGNFGAYNISTNSFSDLVIARNTNDAPTTATTYIYKTQAAANTNFIITFTTPPTFAFITQFRIGMITGNVNVPNGASSISYDYSSNSDVIPGRNEMIITFQIPVGTKLYVANIQTHLPLEYEVTSKRIVVSATGFRYPYDTSPQQDPITFPQQELILVNNQSLSNVIVHVPRTSQNFGDLRIIGGGFYSIRPDNGVGVTATVGNSFASGPINVQQYCMRNVTSAVSVQPDKFKFIVSRGPSGQCQIYNTVQYSDSI